MSYYSDAEDSIKSLEDVGIRKRRVWDPDTESITSEIKDLLDEDVNSLVSTSFARKSDKQLGLLQAVRETMSSILLYTKPTVLKYRILIMWQSKMFSVQAI